jgi:hypothetical protein
MGVFSAEALGKVDRTQVERVQPRNSRGGEPNPPTLRMLELATGSVAKRPQNSVFKGVQRGFKGPSEPPKRGARWPAAGPLLTG